MSMKMTKAAISALALMLAGGGLAANAQAIPGAVAPAKISMFSTENIARQGHFYVGGHYVGEPGKETMDGAMYVDCLLYTSDAADE